MPIAQYMTTSQAADYLNLRDRQPISTAMLIESLREQQLAIVKKLPRELVDEYVRLQEIIKAIERAEVNHALGLMPDKIEEFSADDGKKEYGLTFKYRLPLSVHKENVIEAIRKFGPLTRRAILGAAKVPAGSLSAILKGKEFVRVEGGRWGLKETKGKKTGPSAPTAK